MKTYLDNKYKPSCPEEYNWSLLDTPKVQVIAEKIALAIYQEITTRHRTIVPGLREALRLIAENTEIY